MDVPLWMIVYTRSDDRKQNFESSRENAPKLQRHVALIGTLDNVCDEVNRHAPQTCPSCGENVITWHRTHCCDRCMHGNGHSRTCDAVKCCDGLNSADFMYHRKVRMPGKIGCNLSHQTLWLSCLSRPRCDWVLINEDDVYITKTFSMERIIAVIKMAIRHNSHYVRMEPSRSGAVVQQHQKSHQIDRVAGGMLYRMLPHAGMASYLVDRVGLRMLLNLCPYDAPQDMIWSKIPRIRPLYFSNDMIEMRGCHNVNDRRSMLGSIIMSTPGCSQAN